MLMSRQIDDMLFAVQSKKEFDDAVNELKQHIDIEGEDELASHYNGIELDQRREYIAIKVAVYIVKVCENHGWTRHINTQWFAIQEWKERGDIILQYINTKDNSADGCTKALGRCANKGMGLYGSPYSFGKYKIPREGDKPLK